MAKNVPVYNSKSYTFAHLNNVAGVKASIENLKV